MIPNGMIESFWGKAFIGLLLWSLPLFLLDFAGTFESVVSGLISIEGGHSTLWSKGMSVDVTSGDYF